MTVVYPSLESPEFQQEYDAVTRDIADLVKLFDEHKIEKQEHLDINPATVQSFETVITTFNEKLERHSTLRAYIASFVSTNSRDTTAQAKLSQFQLESVKLSKLQTRLVAWIGSMDVEKLVELSQLVPELGDI